MRTTERKAFRGLLDWFGKRKRDWPWRRQKTPYKVWISEVMLQQTVVSAVAPRFESWMRRFPDLGRLAQASERIVLREWEGLGYYSRARNILSAAKIIRKDYGGQVPRDVAELRTLPGIGPYTAAAIASLAFGLPVPLLDANVRRIVGRIKGWNVWSPVREKKALELLSVWMPSDRASDFNESLMELGQTLCAPVTMDCPRCPLRTICASVKRGFLRTHTRGRQSVVRIESVVAVALDHGRIWLKEETAGRFKGLWTLPRYPGVDLPPRIFTEKVVLNPVVHAYTRYRETLQPYIVSFQSGIPSGFGVRMSLKEAAKRAMPSAHRRILTDAVRSVSENN